MKMIQKRGLLILILINIAFVSATDKVEIPNPEIYVSFTGENQVNVIDFGLYNSTKGSFLVSEVIDDREYDPRTRLHFFHFKPGVLDNPNDNRNFLKNGLYTFVINATDETGNIKYNQKQDFIVEVPVLEIELTKPRHRVSQNESFKVYLKTKRSGNVSNSSECRYNLNADRTWANMVYKFSPLDIPINSTQVTISNITEEKRIYIRCKDIYENTYLKTYDLSIDTTPPIILNAYANPDPVVEEIESNIQTDLTVVADEQVICRYDNNSVNYTEMLYNFSNYDPYDSDAYRTTTASELRFLTDHRQYQKTVICENLAGSLSEPELVEFNTDLDTALSISVIEPSPSTDFVSSTNYISIEIYTNKHTYCTLTTDANISIPIEDDNPSKKIHKRQIPLNMEGRYSYYISCNYYEQTASTSLDYTFDVTKPQMLFVNDTDPHTHEHPDYTYHTDSLYAKWDAEDKVSDIHNYLVQIREFSGGSCNGELIMDWERTSASENRFEDFINDTELIDGQKYCFVVTISSFHVKRNLSFMYFF